VFERGGENRKRSVWRGENSAVLVDLSLGGKKGRKPEGEARVRQGTNWGIKNEKGLKKSSIPGERRKENQKLRRKGLRTSNRHRGATC